MNRHIWDMPVSRAPQQRKAVIAIYCLFCFAAGLVKISILLFYRRLSSRVVSPGFIWTTRIAIFYITVYSIIFIIIPIFGCRPISAAWDQLDIVKQLQGYKYQCLNEGASVITAGVISSSQDLITTILPTFLYWNLRIPIRQKIGLFSIFAVGYGVVAVAILRTYYTWFLFYETYDITWVFWRVGFCAISELHIGIICANAPALKILFVHIFKSDNTSSGARSRSNHFKFSWKKSTNDSSVISTIGTWRQQRNRASQGYISDHHHPDLTIDEHGGLHQNSQIRRTQVMKMQSFSAIDSKSCDVDVEMGDWRASPQRSVENLSPRLHVPDQVFRKNRE
jgi:hypothetical protein